MQSKDIAQADLRLPEPVCWEHKYATPFQASCLCFFEQVNHEGSWSAFLLVLPLENSMERDSELSTGEKKTCPLPLVTQAIQVIQGTPDIPRLYILR